MDPCSTPSPLNHTLMEDLINSIKRGLAGLGSLTFSNLLHSQEKRSTLKDPRPMAGNIGQRHAPSLHCLHVSQAAGNVCL